MFGSLDIVISSVIGLVAVIIAIMSFLEVRKQAKQSEEQTKLLETISKALPYTTGKRRTESASNKAVNSGQALSQTKSNNIKQMKLDLEKEKLQWQKNKDIAKGIAWIIDRLNTDEEYEEE
jgi:type III secretory pathway component EscV